ncbi:hypothetical protein [Candidatus Odyssella acanthamoebae]|uniref:Uncharacterized protein n=1 Tax=Candidatus Odyssella acanthamoebae TaxID=91604 RepID=A0A077AVW8_9PROT|nr:hypothetical protein [Candidatus Paracaedibacter acanthamoebae]AIK95803.1 hypothetical protein ID47_02215 [Candidatus Paracaedibacter acanthamoebae]
MITQKNFKHLLLGVCLSASTALAMEVQPLNDVGGRDGEIWRDDGENVMRRERRDMCRQSAEQLFAVVEHPLPRDTAMQQINTWLNTLKNNPLQYNSAQMMRQVNTPDRFTGIFVPTRNYIDDAIKGFNAIRTHGYYFAEQINNHNVRMDDVLTLVWTAIQQYPQMTNSENAANDQINMRLTLLKKGLAEIVEDDNHTVCGVGQSQRILLPLQGSIDGINIDGNYILNGNGGEVQLDVHGFSTRCNEVVGEYIAGLDDAHPLSQAITGMVLYPNVNAAALRGFLDNIRQRWRDMATRVFARNDDNIRSAQAAIDRHFQQYYNLLRGLNIDNTLGNFMGDINAGINAAFYHDAPQAAQPPQAQVPVVHPIQPPATQLQGLLQLAAQQHAAQQLAAQQLAAQQQQQHAAQQLAAQQRAAQQLAAQQQPQYSVGEVVRVDGVRHRWNGTKLVRM